MSASLTSRSSSLAMRDEIRLLQQRRVSNWVIIRNRRTTWNKPWRFNDHQSSNIDPSISFSHTHTLSLSYSKLSCLEFSFLSLLFRYSLIFFTTSLNQQQRKNGRKYTLAEPERNGLLNLLLKVLFIVCSNKKSGFTLRTPARPGLVSWINICIS